MPPKLPVQPYSEETFGRYLRRVRRLKDEPQSVLREILGSQTVASRVENGERLPGEHTYPALAEYLGLPVEAVSTWLEREALAIERAKLTRRLADIDARLAELTPRRRR